MKKPAQRKPAIPLSQAKKIASKSIGEKKGRFLPIVDARDRQSDASKWIVEFDIANGEEEILNVLDFAIMVLVDKNSGECEIIPNL